MLRTRSTTRASTMEAERRGRAARALEAVGDGVVLVDREGVIRLWNTAAATITGLPESEVLGRPIAEVVTRLERDLAADSRRQQARRAGPCRDGAGRVRRPRAVDLRLRCRLRGGHGLCVPRPDRRARAGGDQGGVRRDRLARAADAARRDLRLGADAPPDGHRRSIPRSRMQLLGVIASRIGPARHDRQRPARRRGSLDADQLPLSVERVDPAELAGAVDRGGEDAPARRRSSSS